VVTVPGPNGGNGFVAPPQGTYIGDIQLGTFQKVLMPDEAQLAVYTKQVIANTFTSVPKRLIPLPKSVTCIAGLICHAYQSTLYTSPKKTAPTMRVLGQLPNAKGDSTLARFGVHCEYTLPDATRMQFPN
jgi:hypothetical protein